jgi:hypothetical protein
VPWKPVRVNSLSAVGWFCPLEGIPRTVEGGDTDPDKKLVDVVEAVVNAQRRQEGALAHRVVPQQRVHRTEGAGAERNRRVDTGIGDTQRRQRRKDGLAVGLAGRSTQRWSLPRQEVVGVERLEGGIGEATPFEPPAAVP